MGLRKGSYTRIGDRDENLTDYEIYSYHSYSDGIYEDTRPIKRASIHDLNRRLLNKYINKIKEMKPNFSRMKEEKLLKLSGIIDSNSSGVYPTLAGLLVFSKYPQSYCPQLFIACSVIPGINLGDVGELGQRFDDNKRVEGTVEEMLEQALSFLRKNMKNRVIIDSETGKRKNVLEYPMLALKEAVANALIHRDYSLQTENAYIKLYMYDDRIEIINPGSLYGVNKMEELGTATIMETRNPNLVRLLEEKGYVIENRHSGIPTMITEMEKYGLSKPELYEDRGTFKVVLRNGNIGKRPRSKRVSEQIHIKNNILKFCVVERSAKEIREFIKFKSRNYVNDNIIKPLIKGGYLEYTNKVNVNASNQKYKTVKLKK